MREDLVLFWAVFLCGSDISTFRGGTRLKLAFCYLLHVLGGTGLGLKINLTLKERLVVADGKSRMATKAVAMGLVRAVLHQTTLGKRQEEGRARLDGMLLLGKPLTRASSLSWTSSLEMGM